MPPPSAAPSMPAPFGEALRRLVFGADGNHHEQPATPAQGAPHTGPRTGPPRRHAGDSRSSTTAHPGRSTARRFSRHESGTAPNACRPSGEWAGHRPPPRQERSASAFAESQLFKASAGMIIRRSLIRMAGSSPVLTSRRTVCSAIPRACATSFMLSATFISWASLSSIDISKRLLLYLLYGKHE